MERNSNKNTVSFVFLRASVRKNPKRFYFSYCFLLIPKTFFKYFEKQ